MDRNFKQVGHGFAMARTARSGFTLIELLVVIAIIAILAAILFPVFAQAREKARQAACLSNMKQIGLAVMQYVQDFDETYPVCNQTYRANDNALGRASWMRHLHTYTKSIDVLKCPNAVYGDDFVTTGPNYNGIIIPGPNNDASQNLTFNRRSLGVNRWVFLAYPPGTVVPPASQTAAPYAIAESTVGRNAELIMVADCSIELVEQPWYITYANWSQPIYSGGSNNATSFMSLVLASRKATISKYARHSGGSTIVYGDGHAKWSKNESLNYDGTNIAANKPAKAVADANVTIYGYRSPIAPDDKRLR